MIITLTVSVIKHYLNICRSMLNFTLFSNDVLPIREHHHKVILLNEYFFFAIWIFFREHLRLQDSRRSWEGMSLTLLYHFHPLYRLHRAHLCTQLAVVLEPGTTKLCALNFALLSERINSQSATF